MTDDATRDSRTRWVVPARTVPKPWGHELIFARVEGRFAGKALHVTAGCSLSLQYHQRKVETIAVQSGRVLFEIGPAVDALDRRDLGPGDTVHVPAGTIHRMTAITDVVMLEVSSDDLDDVVRLVDEYGREGTTAP